MYIEKKFDTGNVLINYAEGSPAGPSIVLIHGIPGHWEEFLPIFRDLSDSYHLYAIDLRGQGKSGRVPGEYHSSYFWTEVVPFIEETIEGPCTLFGMSAGGLISMQVAAQIPEKVARLIIGDSPIDIDWLIAWMMSDGFKALFSALRSLAGSTKTVSALERKLSNLQIPGQDPPLKYAEQPGIDQAHLQQMAEVYFRLDPGVLEYHAEERAKEYLSDFKLAKLLEEINCPTLLIQADPSLGGMMTDRSTDFALSKLKNGFQVKLSGLGHDLGLERADTEQLLKSIHSFLNSL